jgi:YidC/Oxa1 family membrane protein insertase
VRSILAPLVVVLYSIMNFVHTTFGIGWGWSIVVLTIIVRIVLLPLTYRQYKSMRAMQVLQPQLKEIQEKYKSDKQLMQQKVMEFYRENKVSPFSSCLPLVLQMPVFFALFYMLQAASKIGTVVGAVGIYATLSGKFAGSHWLWIGAFQQYSSSLIASDITKFDLPLLLLYVASQFVSSWMMMTSNDQTQRMLMYAMPIGIGVIMYIGRWPAGLFIYWFTSNMWTIGQQYLIKRSIKTPVPAPVAVPVPARAPSGGKSGSSKQRKQSGPKGGKS